MNSLDGNFISIVAYLHKNDSNIIPFLKMINTIMTNHFKCFEIILVNDGAPKQVLWQVYEFKKANEKAAISIITMGVNSGLENSMNAGVDLAIGDYVYEFDSILVDYDGALVMDAYHKVLEGYDIVSTKPQKIVHPRITSVAFYKIYNTFSESKNKVTFERFRVVSRRAINRIGNYSATIPFRKAVYSNIGLKKVTLEYHSNSTSKEYRFVNLGKEETATDAILLFTNTAYRLSLFFSIFLGGAFLFWMVYCIANVCWKAGKWDTSYLLMLFVTGGFFAVFIVLTVIVKYFDVLLKLVFKRQKYLIASIEKL